MSGCVTSECGPSMRAPPDMATGFGRCASPRSHTPACTHAAAHTGGTQGPLFKHTCVFAHLHMLAPTPTHLALGACPFCGTKSDMTGRDSLTPGMRRPSRDTAYPLRELQQIGVPGTPSERGWVRDCKSCWGGEWECRGAVWLEGELSDAKVFSTGRGQYQHR